MTNLYRQNSGSSAFQAETVTIVYVDLARYSQISSKLENDERLGPIATLLLKRQIRELVRRAVEAIDCSFDEAFIEGTGDGAILLFKNAVQADRFSTKLHELSQHEHNQHAQDDVDYRYFRIGVFTGDVVRSGREASGAAISFAARMETAAQTGEVVIDERTWCLLTSEQRQRYDDGEVVRIKKHDPPTVAHRRKVIEPAPWDRDEFSARSWVGQYAESLTGRRTAMSLSRANGA
jgi:class 3 adenylate cyclase